MTKRIALLNCGPVNPDLAPKYGEYDVFFSKLLADEELVFEGLMTHEGELPKSPEAYDGYVLSGSLYGAYEDHDFIPPLEQFIRDVYAANVPLVGICFGHQIMAQALGGKVVKFDGGWGLGPLEYDVNFKGQTSKMTVHAIHQDQVVERPEGTEIIATSEFCENAGLLYQNGKAISFQPHPEFDDEWMDDILSLKRGKGFDEAQTDEALAALGTKLDSSEVGNYMKQILKDE